MFKLDSCDLLLLARLKIFAESSQAGDVGRGGMTSLVLPFVSLDPIVQRLVIRSSTSEGLQLNLDGILPQLEKVEEKEEENAADEDQQKAVQESVRS